MRDRALIQDGAQDGRHDLLMAVNRVKFYIEVFFQRMLVICDITIHPVKIYQNRTIGKLIYLTWRLRWPPIMQMAKHCTIMLAVQH